jgi:hypothetical protein
MDVDGGLNPGWMPIGAASVSLPRDTVIGCFVMVDHGRSVIEG